MTTNSNYYANTVGLNIIIDMGVDVTQATGVYLSVQKPSGQAVTWTPTVINENYLSYTTSAGDISHPGTYLVQPFLTLSGFSGGCDPVKFTITRNI